PRRYRGLCASIEPRGAFVSERVMRRRTIRGLKGGGGFVFINAKWNGRCWNRRLSSAAAVEQVDHRNCGRSRRIERGNRAGCVLRQLAACERGRGRDGRWPVGRERDRRVLARGGPVRSDDWGLVHIQHYTV